MKLALIIGVCFFAVSVVAKVPTYPVSILPDAPGTSYQRANSLMGDSFSSFKETQRISKKTSIVDRAVLVGAKNLAWLKYINENRPEGHKIFLTQQGELRGYPIQEPSFYSPSIISKKYRDLEKTLPVNLKNIIFGNGQFTKNPGIPDEEYRLWALKVDRLYQEANRWLLMLPNLEEYKKFSYLDIRGYFYLTREEDLNLKLKNFDKLSSDKQNQLSKYLVGLCSNSKISTRKCRVQLYLAVRDRRVLNYYIRYLPESEKLYNSFFQISEMRDDVTWTSQNANTTEIPFQSTSLIVEKFLKNNIEEEWSWKGWALRLIFKPQANLHVIFKPNVVPHVPDSNTIVMDENAPLDEWDVRWTIRHEFGHNLGFPDCYVEFYDQDAKAMINYQLDTNNLMCARGGVFMQTHYDELKRVYFQ